MTVADRLAVAPDCGLMQHCVASKLDFVLFWTRFGIDL